jgi:rhodanese-related sulfurtransferase
MQNIDPGQLKMRLDDPCSRPLLIDIREPWEFDICRIEGSENVPMAQLAARMAGLERDRDTVIICHHGLRSRQVAEYLSSLGHGGVLNLEGGLDAWARTIDPDMPQY